MHIMGGFGVASLALSVSNYRNKTTSIVLIMSVYACVAVGWELYELAGDLVNHSVWNGWSDTISDFINGIIGAYGAYYLLKK